jgi:hypothetical protein
MNNALPYHWASYSCNVQVPAKLTSHLQHFGLPLCLRKVSHCDNWQRATTQRPSSLTISPGHQLCLLLTHATRARDVHPLCTSKCHRVCVCISEQQRRRLQQESRKPLAERNRSSTTPTWHSIVTWPCSSTVPCQLDMKGDDRPCFHRWLHVRKFIQCFRMRCV